MSKEIKYKEYFFIRCRKMSRCKFRMNFEKMGRSKKLFISLEVQLPTTKGLPCPTHLNLKALGGASIL